MKNRISTSLKLIAVVLFSSMLFTQAKAQCVANWTAVVTGCTVKFTNTSTGTGSNTTYSWTFGDGQTSNVANPSHTYSVSGSYSICLTISTPANCYSTFCQFITVQCPTTLPCTAIWNWNSTTNSCTVYFSDASTGTNPITSWNWNFGDGQTSTMQNPVHAYSASGSYSVCLTITAATPNGSCTNTLCKTVTVQCPPTTQCAANWGYQTGSVACTIYFSNSSTGTNASTSYSWTFGDGQTSNQLAPVHTYTASGTYTVCLTIVVPGLTGGTCYNTLCKAITVQCGPLGIASSEQAGISLSVTNPIFSSADINYSISSSGNIELVLFDIVGNKISMLENGNKSAGTYSYSMNTSSFSKGIYFIHLSFDEITITKKIIIAE